MNSKWFVLLSSVTTVVGNFLYAVGNDDGIMILVVVTRFVKKCEPFVTND
jgi:hypothetical protein